MDRAATLGILLLLTGALHASVLYQTDFEDFPVGDSLWAGNDGWISNDILSGAQGIAQDLVVDLPLGKTAYLGFDPPAADFTFVARPVNYDPIPTSVPYIQFESFLGIQDSLNGRRDQFFISFYDNAGFFLAAIAFDNTGLDPEILRWEGRADGSIEQVPTGVPFVRGDPILSLYALQLLVVEIDLFSNTWSAAIDGIPLFVGASFTDPAYGPLTLGSVAAEWELATPSLPGDNWLFVADWIIRTAPRGATPFRIDRVEPSSSGEVVITWPGDPGFDYQLEYSSDLVTWQKDLPDSFFPGVTTTGLMSYTDTSPLAPLRFYRVGRTDSP